MAPKLTPAAKGDLTIDTHCHIFNGTDIQLEKFLNETHQGIPPRLVTLASNMEKKSGIQGDVEWKDLVELAKRMKCPVAGEPAAGSIAQLAEAQAPPLSPAATQPADARSQVNTMRNAAYQNAKEGIATTIEKRPPANQKEADADASVKQMLAADSHEGFRKKVDTVKAERSAGQAATGETREPTCGDAKNIGGELDTVVDYFLPRIVLAQLYLDTFCPSAGRNVDLMFAAMVDYDWWLAQGAAPLTPLKEQVKVMEQISILSGGRIHGLAPFCPLREVASRAGQGTEETGWSSLAFVQDTILNRGCVGVKLYPPMGFAPYGNTGLDDPDAPRWDPDHPESCGLPGVHPHSDFWSRNSLLPDWARQPVIRYAKDGSEKRLGARLDDALGDLYKWCQDKGVPILAHTNTTNGVDCGYENLAMAEYWRKALAAYPKLRVSFGHMGGFDDDLGKKAEVPRTSQAFIGLMGDGSAPGDDPMAATYTHAYADSAYDAVLLSCQDQFAQRLDKAYLDDPALRGRFMYGTDWSLMVHVGHNKVYLKDYVALMNRIDKSVPGTGRKPSQAFFGWNAVEYAGLRSTDQARQRLDGFYARYKLQTPGWALKVDAG